ncbi:MAG: glycosyltransferase family 39 protein [Microgenomates group bacterium]
MLGGYLRVINLEKNPPSLGNDEISIAYDSYSMRAIGLDEHGKSWPLSFQSHQTYKAPLYAYLNMPLSKLLGNTEYGVRLLSAIAGVGAIVFIVMIGKELISINFGLMAGLLLAINPRAIFASRIAFESNLAMTIMLVGVWAMIVFIKSRKNIYLVWAGVFLGLSIWGYHTEWGLVPMLAIVWIWLSWEKIKLNKWWPMLSLIILLAAPIYIDFMKVQVMDPNNRASSQLWFSSGQFKDYLKNSQDSQLKKSINLVMTPVYSYISHFSLDTNFSSGGNLFNSRGPLINGWYLLFTLPLLVVGLLNINKIFGQWANNVLSWWLLCPVIPSLTGEVASVRNLAFIIPTTLIIAGGAKIIYEKSYKVGMVLALFITFNFFIFTRAYYVHYPLDAGDNFQYGYKQAWEFIRPNIDKYSRVVVENRFGRVGEFVGVPHLYFGYYGAFTPQEMQKRIDINGTKIGKYEFKYVDWNLEIYTPDTIYIVSAINPEAGLIANSLKEIGIIRNTNNEVQFLIYESVE